MATENPTLSQYQISRLKRKRILQEKHDQSNVTKSNIISTGHAPLSKFTHCPTSLDDQCLYNSYEDINFKSMTHIDMNYIDESIEVLDVGNAEHTCSYCGAIMWYQERANKRTKTGQAIFTICCGQGKVKIPLMIDPPDILKNLYHGYDGRSGNFLENIRQYNMMFSFTSMGGKLDVTLNNGGGPYVYRISGQNCHLMGSLIPGEGSTPKFAQLYIYDTQNEISNRINAVSSRKNDVHFDESLIKDLKHMLDEHNVLAKSFRITKDRYTYAGLKDVKLKLIGNRLSNGRTYNLPTIAEVAGLIVGDVDSLQHSRDIIVETQNGSL